MLTREQKIKIFVMRTDGYTMQEIADKCGMTRENVRLVINGLLDKKPPRGGNMYPAIQNAFRRKGISIGEISRRTKISPSTLYRAVNRGGNPNKKTIDVILSETGLTYEEAFEEEAETIISADSAKEEPT